MITAWYVGNHKKDGAISLIGYWMIRIGQWRQLFGRVTHCEALLIGPWYSAVIAGCSRKDGKRVRVKLTELNPGNWRIIHVPSIDAEEWEARFKPLIGTPYSDAGAVSSASPFWSLILGPFVGPIALLGQWCSRTLLQCMGIAGAEDLSVSEAMTVVMALPGSEDITDAYFAVTRPEGVIPSSHPLLPTTLQEKEATA